jgi:hypothetical protein
LTLLQGVRADTARPGNKPTPGGGFRIIGIPRSGNWS